MGWYGLKIQKQPPLKAQVGLEGTRDERKFRYQGALLAECKLGKGANRHSWRVQIPGRDGRQTRCEIIQRGKVCTYCTKWKFFPLKPLLWGPRD